MCVGKAEQFVENPCIALLSLRLSSTLTHDNRELTGQQRSDQKNEQGNPFLPTCNRKGVQGRHEEEIEGEKGSNRGKHSGIASKGTRQQENQQQIDKRNVWYLWVEMEEANQSGHRQRAANGQHTLQEEAWPVKRRPVFKHGDAFYSLHSYFLSRSSPGVFLERRRLSQGDIAL